MCFWKKKKLENCKFIYVMTNYEENQVSYVCENPNNGTNSQVLSPLAIMDENNTIKMNTLTFWSDSKLFKNLKPNTVYKVFYKDFEPLDVRSKYPSSLCLVEIKECKKNDSEAKQFVDRFQEYSKQLKTKEEKYQEEEQKRREELGRKIRESLQRRTLKYGNTSFELILDDFDYDEVTDPSFSEEIKQKLADENVSEAEKEAIVVKEFSKKKDQIIKIALDGAVKELLENAKDWTNNPNLTKEEFISNLLTEDFTVHLYENGWCEIWFWTNEMFTDHNVECDVSDGVCTSACLQG